MLKSIELPSSHFGTANPKPSPTWQRGPGGLPALIRRNNWRCFGNIFSILLKYKVDFVEMYQS